MHKYHQILENFGIHPNHVAVSHITNGNINDTFRVRVSTGRRRDIDDYLLQRINHHVFKNPGQVMENIISVTRYLCDKITAAGGDQTKHTLSFLSTHDGEYMHRCPEGCCWRVCNYIDGASTYDVVDNPDHFYSAGRTYGRFLKLLCDYPVDTLHETITDFHNTPVRVEAFKHAVRQDPVKRVSRVKDEIEFLLQRTHLASGIVDLITAREVPMRVTHNDTKLNNVLIEDHTGEGICVIDLDTVMPGSCLYDFGDAVRSGANPGGEETTDLQEVGLDLTLFELYTRGYLEETGDTLCAAEKENLAFAVKLMTYELAMRFLTDYLNGDIYFKTRTRQHNRSRARTQIKLLTDIEQKYHHMEAIVSDFI